MLNVNRDMGVPMDVGDMMEDDKESEGQVESQLGPAASQSTTSHASGSISRVSSMGVEHSSPYLTPGHDHGRSMSTSSSLGIESMLGWAPGSSSSGNSRASSVNSDVWYPVESSENRKFKILYVPDPSRTRKRVDAENNLSWTLRDIRIEQFEAIKDLTGSVYKCRMNRTAVKVLLTEWVSATSLIIQDFGKLTEDTILQLWLLLRVDDFEDGSAFDVTYMSWETFLGIVLDPPNNLGGWTTLTQMDCIIGGFDYSTGHWCVHLRSNITW